MKKTFTTPRKLRTFAQRPVLSFTPKSSEEIYEAFQLAKKMGLTVTLRGAGRSYNDAALNGGGIVLDLSGMNQILEWDPGHRSGAMRAGRHAGTALAESPAGWLVAARRLWHDEDHAGRLSCREHPRQE